MPVTTHRTNIQEYLLVVFVAVNQMHSAVCPELCINSNTQKQPQHFCRFPSTSSLQGIAQNNTVHMSGSNTALTEEWLIFLRWPDSHLNLLAQSSSSSHTADGPVPAEKNPQAGTSQPVRHANLTLRPGIKVSKEGRIRQREAGRGGWGWEDVRTGWKDRQTARSVWRGDRRKCKNSKDGQKTGAEMAGGNERQVACGGVC